MKKIITLVTLLFGVVFSINAQDGQTSKVISLEQTPGEFTQKGITVSAGTYVFAVHNNEVGHDVGFVLVEKGRDVSKPENHIQTAYVTKAVANGKTQHSKPTVLQAGEYIYFCPLNPTAIDNVLVVK
ncbi:plastocyanin/azurin family copper-binding protein [Kriegella aquimaris]|uniref:Copper binding protein, plastocyanin/azurin family n=1 Tax=Kriegella aquimaris TaxID=192904 RepID=A0A1G9LPG5_9FLAO|nr:plastocyanin/azurin family copper-binding protein [Kriegella aquimaris]SDL63798.1 Copper binding protein, plastocyanin/azurin family [Kriegella aquimaris]